MLVNFVFSNKIVCYQPYSNMKTLNQNATEKLITEKLEKYIYSTNASFFTKAAKITFEIDS